MTSRARSAVRPARADSVVGFLGSKIDGELSRRLIRVGCLWMLASSAIHFYLGACRHEWRRLVPKVKNSRNLLR